MVFKQVLARAKEFGRATKLPWLSDSLRQPNSWSCEETPWRKDFPGTMTCLELAWLGILQGSLWFPRVPGTLLVRSIPDSQWEGCICVLFSLPTGPSWLTSSSNGELLPLEQSWEQRGRNWVTCFRTSLVFGRSGALESTFHLRPVSAPSSTPAIGSLLIFGGGGFYSSSSWEELTFNISMEGKSSTFNCFPKHWK